MAPNYLGSVVFTRVISLLQQWSEPQIFANSFLGGSVGIGGQIAVEDCLLS